MIRFSFMRTAMRPSLLPPRPRRLQPLPLLGAMLAVILDPAASATQDRDAALLEANFAALRLQQAHLAEINYRLATANDALCDTHLPQTGLVVQDKSQFVPKLRDAAARFFHLEDGPAIMVVVPGSPADKAGLKADDVITAVNDAPLPAEIRTASTQRASYDIIATLTAFLDAAFGQGAATLSIRRGEERLRLTVTPVRGCRSRVDLSLAREMNSYADGLTATISTAVVGFAQDDDELAVVLGHEMSHNIQHDRDPSGSGGRIDDGTVSVRQSESEADYVGVYLMARAGYDFRKAPAFWQRFGKGPGFSILGTGNHPGWSKRIAVTETAVHEIERKRALGLPLVPNLPFFAGQPKPNG